jgi:hypothetical protein
VDIDTDDTILKITVGDYFEDTLAGDGGTAVTDQSWVKFMAYNREYSLDTWPTGGYLNDAGEVLSSGLELYAYAGEQTVSVSGEAETVSVSQKPIQFLRLPQYAYTETDSSNHNCISIDVKQFSGTPDNIDSFLILPPAGLKFTTDSNLSNWINSNFVKISDGFYGPESMNRYMSVLSGDISDLADTDSSSACEVYVNITNPS